MPASSDTRHPAEETQAEFEKLKCTRLRTLRTEFKRAQKWREKAEKQLAACRNWPAMQHEALLLQANLFRIKKGMAQVEVNDWEQENAPRILALDPLLTPSLQVESRFKQAKKLRRGVPHQEVQLAKAEEACQRLEQLLKAVEAVATRETLEGLLPPSPPKEKKTLATPPAKALPYRVFRSAAGTEIWVGKGAKDNDVLTFHYARGSDWWLHVHDYPGSHVVIRTGNDEPDANTLQDALQLAIHYSRAKGHDRVDVCVTQCKYVAKPGKKAGTVHVSKHKIVKVDVDTERLHLLKHSSKKHPSN